MSKHKYNSKSIESKTKKLIKWLKITNFDIINHTTEEVLKEFKKTTK